MDEAAAQVVKRIFKLVYGRPRADADRQSSCRRNRCSTPPPISAEQGIKTPSPETADPYHWNTNTVVHILERREYTGCTVNFKTYTNSIWDKKQRDTPHGKAGGFLQHSPGYHRAGSL